LSDLFGVGGNALLDRLRLPAPYVARIASLRRLLDHLDCEIDLFDNLVRGRLRTDPGYTAVQQIPGIGPVLGAVFVAEVGDVHRFGNAAQLTCWAGLTPKHHESDTHVRRGRITKQGSRLVRWAAVESVKRLGAHTPVGALRERVAAPRGANIGAVAVAAARRQVEYVFYALRDGHVRALQHPSPATA
jgi:transposase